MGVEYLAEFRDVDELHGSAFGVFLHLFGEISRRYQDSLERPFGAHGVGEADDPYRVHEVALGHEYAVDDVVAPEDGRGVVRENVDFLLVDPVDLDDAHVHALEQVHEHALERLRRKLAQGFDFRIVPGLLGIGFERDVRGRSLDEQDGNKPQEERDEDEF